MARHDWTAGELDVLRQHPGMGNEELKRLYFSDKADVTVIAIASMKSALRFEEYPASRAWTLADFEFLVAGIDRPNAENALLMRRRPKEIDRMRHRIRNGLRTVVEGVVVIGDDAGTVLRQERAVKAKVKSDKVVSVIPELEKGDALGRMNDMLVELMGMDERVIDELRAGAPFREHGLLVRVYDYLRARQVKDVCFNDSGRVMLRQLRHNVERRVHFTRQLEVGQSAAVSTFSNNVIKMICGFAPTSWRNIQVHTHVDELHALGMALLDYCQDKVISRPKK